MDNKKALFSVLKDLLFQFDSVCRENGLTYSIFAGTLIGAVRHKGFIPWDDDIDVVMPRKDYDKLLSLPDTTFKFPYFLQTPITDHGYHKGIIRLRNSNTTEISIIDAAFDCNHGAFIDIFPLDAVTDDKNAFRRQVKELQWQVKLLHFAGRYNSGVGSLGLSSKMKVAYYCLLPLYKAGILTTYKIFKKYNAIAARYDAINTARVGTICFSFDGERFIYERKDYEVGYIDIVFEDLVVKAPLNYDSILTQSYKDYMTPVKAPSCHGETIFDMNTPYKKYVKENKEKLISLWLSARQGGQ